MILQSCNKNTHEMFLASFHLSSSLHIHRRGCIMDLIVTRITQPFSDKQSSSFILCRTRYPVSVLWKSNSYICPNVNAKLVRKLVSVCASLCKPVQAWRSGITPIVAAHQNKIKNLIRDHGRWFGRGALRIH